MRRLWKYSLITSSLLPLYVLTWIRIADSIDILNLAETYYLPDKMLPLAFISFISILIIWGLVSLIVITYSNRSFANKKPYIVVSSEEDSDVNIDFFITLIIPLIMVDIATPSMFIMYVCILIFIYLLMWKSRKYYANPVLFIFGYKVYCIELDNCSKKQYVLSKQDIQNGDIITLYRIEENTCYSYKQEGVL